MVKFKFPGKPSKIVQRSLVSAYSVVVPSCDTSSVSEDVCFGLSLFQSTFGNDDDGDDFTGFTNEDIDEARLKKRTQENRLCEKMISRGLRIPIIPLTRVVLKDNSSQNTSRQPVHSVVKKSVKECISKNKERKKSSKLWLLNKRILNRYHPKIQIRHNFKALNKNSLMRFKHKSLSANYLSDRYCRKFVLPTRSLHSSRVIKPNKRFIDLEKNSKFKPKDKHLMEYENLYGDDYASNSSSSEHEKKRAKIETPSSKVIIREARLNITTETTITGPFSAKKFVSVDKESRSGVITCGICGSVRFYKYVLQTRKFGIYSCEPCRRFILKMIKYSKLSNFEVLKCRADDDVGNCVILPVPSSRRKDSNEDLFAKNSRCDACLLSLCLQKYIMPTSTKKSLFQLIPEDVKSHYLNELSPDFKKSLPALDHPLGGLSKPVSNEETHDKLRKRLNMHNYLKNVRCSKRALDKYDIGVTKSKAFLHKRNNLHQRMSLRNKFIQDNPRKETYPEKDHYVPRGPRIKHVCRSASSVLKTPSNDKELEEPVCNLSESDCVENSRKNENKISEKSSQMTKIRQCDDSFPNPADSSSDDSVAKMKALHYGARTLQDFGKESSDESDEVEDKLISTDFWEAYDPDEVYKTGFPLISSELLNVRALCFLCGSAGIEKLLYCVSCCEPYHWYCAEGPSAFREESELEKCRVNWVCRKCKVCSTCGDRDSRLLISCQRCKNSYHNECLPNKTMNKRLFKSDRPWVCPTCLKCKSCNSNSVFTYVGNIPLCSQCFKLRQNGSFCPLCQRCYQDDDYNVKMMECGICEKWIHAKCEGLSHEKYQILSFLPDTIEFVCRLCCSVPPAQWWLAVEEELKAGYLGILKCLCKNKKISDLFKESPRKNMCRCTYKKRTSISDDSDSCIDTDPEVKAISSDSSVDKCDSGVDDMKDDSADSRADEIQQRCSFCCYNSETRHKINNDLLSIKAKVHNNQYSSLLNFHQELQSVIEEVEELDLVQTYRDSLKKFFPWFDPDCLQNDDTQDYEVVESSVNESSPLIDDSALENAIAEEENVNLKALMATDEYNYENFKMLDLRKCNLCKGTGEAVPSEGGRLIYCGRNEWVHSNCALWSSEVFEEIDGSLQNVHSAISRGRQIRCIVCDKKGASVGCCYKNCTQTYHFLCAKKANCVFLQNRTIYCYNHDTNEVTLPFLSSEKDFEILRPVYIEMDRKKKKLECHSNVKLRIGSLHVENLGKIDPHLSDNPKYILPIYFRCTRLFWSTTKPWKIIQYHIQIKLRYCYETVKSDSEVNYTVDHSTVQSAEQDEKVVKQVVTEVVNKVSSKDDYGFLGTQNGNDLLPPELQEAIYKDLPNDLLNDKTLQDIWNNYDTTNDSDGAKNHPRTVKLEMKKIDAASKISGLDCTRKNDENRTKINGKYLRDKNDLKEDGLRKNHSDTLGNFYNELCNKVKRKINFENSTLNAKKKLFDGNYITAEKLSPIGFYQEADKGYKPPYVQSYENILQLDGMVDIHDEEPVKCDRCHRTYRTTSSFERHLEICTADFNDYMISSCESDTSSEEERFNTSTKTTSPEDPTYPNVQAKYEVITIQEPKPISNVQTYSTNVCDNLGQNTVYTFAAVQENGQTVDNQMQNNGGIFVQNLKQQSLTIAPQPMLKFNVITGKMKPNVIANDYRTQYAVSSIPNTQPYQLQNMGPTYVIQSLPKPDGIPTYVAVNNTITECIQTQETLLQQPLQLQQFATVNQPSMNFQPVIPTILGTVMQPNGLETPTYYINAPAQSTDLYAAQDNIMLPNQPMLFGTETMVSNTVMSQSQYMTQSLTGNMGSSTMYSTMTTQVFQAAKQQPQTIPSGFIVVNSPIQQTVPVQQPVPMKQPQVVNHVPTSSTEKYMYVQINPQNVPKPEKAPKPTITKTVKNHAIPKDKPTKVMRVKNNKPVAVQAAPVNVKTYQSNCIKLNGSSKPVPNGYYTNHVNNHVTMPKPVRSTFKSVPVQSALPTVTVPPINAVKPMLPAIVRSAPKPQPVAKPFVRKSAVPKMQKVDKCVNTDRKEPPVVNDVAKHTIATNTSNERTIQISYTIDNEENLQLPDSLVKSWQVTIPVEENVVEPEQLPSPRKVESPTFQPSSIDMPDLSFFEQQEAEVSKPQHLEKVEIKSDSEKLFDELLRQHMLSMNSVDIAKQDIRIEEPPEPKNCKMFSKNKYKPQITKKLSPNAEESKDVKSNGKRKISLEKENFNKLKNLITEAEQTKNWKTASISFEVNAEDGFNYKTNNLMDLWNKIIESVQKSRAKCKLPLLPKNAVVNADSVYSLLGFENNASKYLLEQLPDAWKCIFYKPVFHKSPMQNNKTSPTKNETGCARTEPFNSAHKYDMFGWLASRHRKPPKFMMLSDSDIVNGNRRVTSLNLPMAMRFRHLKETAKETVGVFRSDIHGRGLFCLRDIDPGEMVIEYAGEVIRSTLTDKREKYYTSKGIGCYMFRIDDKYVVDATMCGNAARFINHSCEPNCYSRIVDILGKKHILIFALRKIPKGEELTYDYKFPLEDDKIHCHCLSRKCRKYLN